MRHVYISREELEVLLSTVIDGREETIIKEDIFGENLETIYLSERNVRTLLGKLDRKAQGEDTSCTIKKNDTVHKTYPCSVAAYITAVEDNALSPSGAEITVIEDGKYYSDRGPGEVHYKEEILLSQGK